MPAPSSLPFFRVKFGLGILTFFVLALVLLPESSSSKQNDSALTPRSVTTSNQFGVANASDVNQSGDYVFIPQGSSAIFLRKFSTGITSRIFQMREQIPGIPNTRSDLITSPRINSSAKVAFLAEYAQTDGQLNRALLLFDGTNLQKIIASTDIAPNTGNSTFGRLITFGGLNDAGDIAFVSPLTSGTSPTLFFIPAGGSPVRVAGPGDVAPGTGGGTLSSISLASALTSLNNNGEIVFSAQVVGGNGGFGVFVGSTLGVRKVVANGDANPVSGTFTINSALGARLNNFSQVAFISANTIWTHNSEGGISKAVGAGDTAPAALGGTFSGIPSVSAFNSSGAIVFFSNIAGSGVTTSGIFRFVSSATIETVAYVNQSAPGQVGAIFSSFSFGSTAISMNNSGLVCFTANLTGAPFRAGAFQQEGVTAPVKITLAGEVAPVPGGGNLVPATFGGTRVLDSGQVTIPSNIIGTGATFAEFIGTPGNLTPLMHDNDSLPAGSLTSLRTFRVGAAGQYAGFLAQQAGGRFSLMVKHAGTGIVSTVFTDGDTAPGTPGFRLRLLSQNTVYVNSSGMVVFPALIIGGNIGINEGIFTATPSGVISKVVANGDLDPVNNSPLSTVTFNALAPSPINDAGQVVFRGFSQSLGGIYVGSSSGTIERIALATEAAPGGGSFTSSLVQTNMSINQSGLIAFVANTSGGPGQNQGVFVRSPGGSLNRIAVSGDPAPGGGTFFRFPSFPSSVSLNDSGEVAFIATLGPAGATGGVFMGSSQGNLQAVALHGSPSPVGGTFQITGASADVSLNNQHDVAFRSALAGATGDSGYFIRRGPFGALQKVVVQGDAAPGTTGNFLAIQSSPNQVQAELFALGPTGEVAFLNSFQSGGATIFGSFRFRNDNLLEKLVVRGDVVPDTGGGISGGTSQGFGTGVAGLFAFWVPIIGGNGEDLIYFTNSPTGLGISGQVKDVSGTGIGGVTVTLSGTASGSTTTSGSGNYTFANLPVGGNYLVTPASSNYSFSPLNQTFNNLTAAGIANFVGTQTIASVSGRVTDGNNVGLNAITLALTKDGVPAGSVQTNPQGDYTFPNLTTGANYVVTPVGSFTPSNQTFNSLSTNATANFKTTQSLPPQCSTVGFAAATNFPVGTFLISLAGGDFNGDGKLDLAVGNQGSGSVSMLLGSGTGSFSAPTNFPISAGVQRLTTGDFNGDGLLDLVAGRSGSNAVAILLGTGTGAFGAATNFVTGTDPVAAAVGDFNADGNADLAVTNAGSANVSVLLGTGTGSFGAPTNFAVGTSPQSVAIGDFNADSKLDLAVANFTSNNVSILAGTGTGTFGAATNFAVDTFPRFVAVHDLNGDGLLDLVTANQANNTVSILLGNGTGTFGLANNFATGATPFTLAVGDFNGDSKLDVVTANSGTNNASVLLGTGVGSFGPATNFTTGSQPFSVVAGDYNGDGKSDLAAANRTTGDVSILLNNTATCNTQTSLSMSGLI